jgi:hypothetical protein
MLIAIRRATDHDMDRRFLIALVAIALVFCVWLANGLRARVEPSAPSPAADADEIAPVDEALEPSGADASRTEVARPVEHPKSASAAVEPTELISGSISISGNGWIFGHVSDPSGLGPGVTGGQITVYFGNARCTPVSIDANGDYRVEMVGAGERNVSCAVIGYKVVESKVTVGDDGTRCDFELTPVFTFRVVLRDPHGQLLTSTDSQELREALSILRPALVADCPSRGISLPAGTSIIPHRGRRLPPNTEGWYEIDPQSTERFCCCVLAGDYVLDAVLVPRGAKEITLVVALSDVRALFGSVKLSVVADESGEPLLNTRVTLTPSTGKASQTLGAARGNVGFERVIAGECAVSVHAPGRVTVTRSIAVRSGEVTDVGVVRLIETVSISGRVRGPALDGKRLLVRLGLNDGPAPGTIAVHAWSIPVSTDGTFRFVELAPATYVLGPAMAQPPPDPDAVRRGLHPGWTWIDARGGSLEGVVLDLPQEVLDALPHWK